jgi:hypothetical protein
MADSARGEVARRVLARLDELVERMGAAYRDEVPEYAALTEVEMAGEVLPVSRAIVAAFFEAAAADRAPDVGEIGALQRMGARRLEMGVPLEPMLHVYRVAGRTVWSAMVEATREGEEPALADLGGAWMDFVDRAASVAASGYLDASHDHLRRLDARRTALLEALLAAGDAADVAALRAEFTTPLAARYQPVLVAGDDVASRIDDLAAACPPGTLSGHRGGHVLLLAAGEPDLARLLRRTGDGVVVHGPAAAPGPSLTAEVRHAEQLVEVAWAAGRRGVFGTDDLLIDQLVAGSPRASAALVSQVLHPLRAGDRTGVLVATLATWLATGTVPETARREVVHPNTVSYRLRRVKELTGLDPRIPNDATLLSLALAASAPHVQNRIVDSTDKALASYGDSG